jgi:GNAT superfamily N-acetyltransferase
MKSQRIAMTVDEYHLLEMKPGWRYEYWDGKAHITPSPRYAITTLTVEPRPVERSVKLRAVKRSDEEQLTEVFYEAFKDTSEYCDWEEDDIYQSAVEGIQSYYSGKRGRPHTASYVAVIPDENSKEKIAGAALLVQGIGHPFLDILFIHPAYQQRGLATLLVSAAVNRLHKMGVKRLSSAYRLCNETSARWHRRFGFVEEPDLSLAQLLLRCTQHELWRRQQIGDISDAEMAALHAQALYLEEMVQTLEEIAEREGLEAVYPALRSFQQ